MQEQFLPGFEKNHRACRYCGFKPGGHARCSRSNTRLANIDEPCTFNIEEAKDGEAPTQDASEDN